MTTTTVRRSRPLLLVVGSALALSACGASAGADGGASVAVDSSDSACSVARTELAAGATELSITNSGASTTEVYVYDAAGDVVGEREDIAPGTSQSLTVDLEPGRYEVTCKPGQSGEGIATPVTVA